MTLRWRSLDVEAVSFAGWEHNFNFSFSLFTQTDEASSGGLSDGGKIGLVVFFILLIAVVLIVGAIYYMRHRRKGFSLHKSFSNPVHMDINNDEIDIINYAE